MIRLFSQPWNAVPTAFLDTETTGVRPGIDKTLQFAIVRFEGGVAVGEFSSLVNPGIPIPEAATAIHGIADAMVADAPKIEDVFASTTVQQLLEGAQPGAYNQGFDRMFVPPFGDDWAQPWLDSLTIVRVVDRFARGAGRHKLSAACARHGVELVGAHGALPDARAAGELFYKLAPGHYGESATVGAVLRLQRIAEAESWYQFNEWLARQPPKEEATNAHG